MEMKRLLRTNWDRALAVGLLVLGAVSLLLGWIGVSGTGIAAEQNPYLISGGLVGIALTIVGCTLWVSADLQDEWRRLDDIEDQLRGGAVLTRAHPSTSGDAAPAPEPELQVPELRSTEQLVAASARSRRPRRRVGVESGR